MTPQPATPVNTRPVDESPEEALTRRLDDATDTGSELHAFQQYSAELCAGLDADGVEWECPEDSVGLVPTEAGKAVAAALAEEVFAEFTDLKTCSPTDG